jgi:hypothetical protein
MLICHVTMFTATPKSKKVSCKLPSNTIHNMHLDVQKSHARRSKPPQHRSTGDDRGRAPRELKWHIPQCDGGSNNPCRKNLPCPKRNLVDSRTESELKTCQPRYPHANVSKPHDLRKIGIGTLKVFSKRYGTWKRLCDWRFRLVGPIPRRRRTSYTGSLLPLPVLCFRHAHQNVFILDRNPRCQHLHGIFEVGIKQDRPRCMH